jgi:phage gpG-like protein
MIPAVFPRITFDRKFFRDIGAIEAAIELLGINLNDFREPLKASLELVIMPSIATNFQTGGRPKWKPLSESWRLKRTPGPILVQTGAMFEATQSITNWDVDHNSITMTGVASAPYAGYHQAGTRRMPARPFVMYQPEDVENIVQIFEIWVDGLIDRYWTKF